MKICGTNKTIHSTVDVLSYLDQVFTNRCINKRGSITRPHSVKFFVVFLKRNVNRGRPGNKLKNRITIQISIMSTVTKNSDPQEYQGKTKGANLNMNYIYYLFIINCRAVSTDYFPSPVYILYIKT